MFLIRQFESYKVNMFNFRANKNKPIPYKIYRPSIRNFDFRPIIICIRTTGKVYNYELTDV